MEETLASQKMAKIDLINQYLPFWEKEEFLPFFGNLKIDH